MKRKFLTVYEAKEKFDISMGYLRLLLGKGILKGEQAEVTQNRQIWLIDTSSLKAFLSKERKPGPRPKKMR